jgi:hypothetical protein
MRWPCGEGVTKKGEKDYKVRKAKSEELLREINFKRKS